MITDGQIIDLLCKRINSRLGGKHTFEVGKGSPFTIKIDGVTEFTYDYSEDVITCLQGFEQGLQMAHRV